MHGIDTSQCWFMNPPESPTFDRGAKPDHQNTGTTATGRLPLPLESLRARIKARGARAQRHSQALKLRPSIAHPKPRPDAVALLFCHPVPPGATAGAPTLEAAPCRDGSVGAWPFPAWRPRLPLTALCSEPYNSPMCRWYDIKRRDVVGLQHHDRR
ncbi:hypothetical protein E4U54_007448 [Claviceps lovelessii]|nr:hypothetical protein E4U54_007448 [Claviceps lovelessii]